MAVAFSRQRLKPEIQCVSADSPQHCMERIQVGRAGGMGWQGQCLRWSLPGPPSFSPGLEDTGQLERKKVSCDNPTEGR